MFKKLYELIFIEQATNKLSHTKMWSNVGYAIMCWSFVHVVLEGKTDIAPELWILFGVTVIGNKSLHKYLDSKGNKQ